VANMPVVPLFIDEIRAKKLTRKRATRVRTKTVTITVTPARWNYHALFCIDRSIAYTFTHGDA